MTKFAKTYGGALYDLAKDEGLDTKILEDLKMVINTVKEVPEYLKLLSTPALSKEEKAALVDETWGQTLHPYTINFLKLIGDMNHVYDFLDCKREFHERYDKDHNIVWVRAFSAHEMTDSQKEQLRLTIEKKIGKTVHLTTKIDKTVLGGVKLDAEGIQYDNTVAFHFNNLSQQLKKL